MQGAACLCPALAARGGAVLKYNLTEPFTLMGKCGDKPDGLDKFEPFAAMHAEASARVHTQGALWYVRMWFADRTIRVPSRAHAQRADRAGQGFGVSPQRLFIGMRLYISGVKGTLLRRGLACACVQPATTEPSSDDTAIVRDVDATGAEALIAMLGKECAAVLRRHEGLDASQLNADDGFYAAMMQDAVRTRQDALTKAEVLDELRARPPLTAEGAPAADQLGPLIATAETIPMKRLATVYGRAVGKHWLIARFFSIRTFTACRH